MERAREREPRGTHAVELERGASADSEAGEAGEVRGPLGVCATSLPREPRASFGADAERLGRPVPAESRQSSALRKSGRT